ncbi:MAG: GlxA family transcriptional regulator [Gammaproteobacteria bacterium]
MKAGNEGVDMPGEQATRTIAMVGFEGIQILDVTGPLEVFSRASRLLLEHGQATVQPYRVVFTAREAGPVECSCGLALVAQCALRDLGAADTVLVSGGVGTRAALHDADLVEWIRDHLPQARRFGAVCTGALLLARAGLLEGRRITTHWAFIRNLVEFAPSARVEEDAIFVRDGRLWTSAGVTAGMDMALAMVEEDWGRKLALDVAHQLVMHLKRAGGSSQVSASLAAQARAVEGRFRQLATWVSENLAGELSIESMAAQSGMSVRHFARCFNEEIGMTPAKYVERVRFEAAQQLLAQTDATVERVAESCGFGSAETLRRVFLRRTGVGPAAYRLRARRAASYTETAQGTEGL